MFDQLVVAVAAGPDVVIVALQTGDNVIAWTSLQSFRAMETPEVVVVIAQRFFLPHPLHVSAAPASAIVKGIDLDS